MFHIPLETQNTIGLILIPVIVLSAVAYLCISILKMPKGN